MEEKKPYQFDAHAIKESCVDWTRNWFRENGDGCNAIVGISGGKDSSVVAALCVEALGRDRVFGVMMPNGEQPDIGDSRKLVEHLGIDYICVNIHQAILAIKHEVRPQLHDRWSTQTSVNLPARIRMATLYAVSQSMNGTRRGTETAPVISVRCPNLQRTRSWKLESFAACQKTWFVRRLPMASAERQTRIILASLTEL